MVTAEKETEHFRIKTEIEMKSNHPLAIVELCAEMHRIADRIFNDWLELMGNKVMENNNEQSK